MKINKQLLNLIIIVCIIFTTPAPITYASGGNVLTIGVGGSYATLPEAIAVVQDGDTLLLLNDIAGTINLLDATDKTITIDGQGHKITGMNNQVEYHRSSAIFLEGGGTVVFKNITLQGGSMVGANGDSMGLYVGNTCNVNSIGTVSVYGGQTNPIWVRRSSYGVFNEGGGTINLTTATGGNLTNFDKQSFGIYNTGGATINVITATGKSCGVWNHGRGTVNVSTVNGVVSGIWNDYNGVVNITSVIATDNVDGMAIINGDYGTPIVNCTVNVTKATTYAVDPTIVPYNFGYAVENLAPGIANADEVVGKTSDSVNRNVSKLYLERGNNASCVLDFITVAAASQTTIGGLPSVYCNESYSNKWYTDSAKTTVFTGTTVNGGATLYSDFYNPISGKITGSDTGTGLAANLQLRDITGKNVGNPITANPDGTYTIKASVGTGYTIEVSMAGYKTGGFPSFNLTGPPVTGKDLTLEKIVSPTTAPTLPNQTGSLTLSKSALRMIDGNQYTLKATPSEHSSSHTFRWMSNNKAIASVNAKGKITAKKAGTATITCATIINGVEKKSTCKITVSESTASTLKVAWKKNSKAKGYQVSLYNGSHLISKHYTTKPSYQWKKLSSGTTYKAVIKPYTLNGKKKKIGSVIATIQSATRPSSPTLTPTAGKNRASLHWKKIRGATGYTLYLSLKKSSGFQNIKTISKGTPLRYTKTKLKKGTTFYFKIRAFKTVDGQKVYGKYSKVKYIKVQ